MGEMSNRVKLALEKEATRLAGLFGKAWMQEASSFEALARAAIEALR